MHHRLALPILACSALFVAGCQTDGLDAIDREVTAMLRSRHFETLGPKAPLDDRQASLRESDPTLTGKAYDHAPATVLLFLRAVVLYVPLAWLLQQYYGFTGILVALALTNAAVGLLSYLWNRKVAS